MSKASPAESPKKDSTKKPVLGKFGNLFNTSKKKQSKGVPESPTSPSSEKTVTTFKSEKEIVKTRKKVQIVVTTNSKSQTQVGSSARPELHIQHGSKDSVLPVGQSDKKTTNGNGENADQKSASPVKEVEHTSADTPADHTNALTESTQKLPQKSTPKFDRQSSIEKSVQASTQYLARRRSSGDGEKSFVRRLSQDSNAAKDELPKTVTKKVSRFSGKVTDSKYKVPDKPLLKGSTEKLSTTKISHQVTSTGDQQNQGSPVEQSLCPDTTDSSILHRQPSEIGTLSPTSPSEGDLLTGSLQGKPKDNCANGHSSNGKVLSVDIYLSKNTENCSPTTTQGCTNGEAMEKNSPTTKKPIKKRRSTKSQSSQNEEKKTETLLQDDVFDENSFKGVQENSSISDSSIKSAPRPPESNGTESSSQEMKAGATKLSPKAESDKDKQHHPASSPLRKKNLTAWAPSSPTGRKQALVRDTVFRNQTAAAPARGTEFNQPASVTTTKDAYVEKASVPGSLTGNGGEDLSETAGDKSSSATAAGILLQNDGSQQESIQALLTSHSDSTDQPSNPVVAEPQNSLNDHSKSIITSQLNIPAKPKNVELPIKPKAASTIDDPTIEVRIPKGNIASKVSLFESKKTSHRQIDFYATKNISQPKKFVERAKLNFGKQVKGNILKDSSFKPAGQLNTNSGKKTENVHSVTKVDTDINVKPPINFNQSKDSSVVQGIHMPMEEETNGLNTVLESTQTTQSILPLAENEQHNCQPSKIPNGEIQLTANNTKENGLEPIINPEENLPHLSQDSDICLEGNTGLQKSSGNISSETGHIDMGNKTDSLLKQPDDDPIPNKPTVYLANDIAPSSNHVNSSEPVSATLKPAEDQFNDSKEVLSVTKELNVSSTVDAATLPSDCVDSSETAISIRSNGLESEKESEGEHLPPSSDISKNSLGGNIASLKSSDDSGLAIVHSTIANEHEVKEQFADVGTTEDKAVFANDPTILPSSYKKKTDEDQIHGAKKEQHDLEKAPEQQILKSDKTKSIMAKEGKPEEALHGDVKQDLQNEDLSSPPIENTNLDDNSAMSDRLLQSEEITQEEQEQPVQITKAEEMPKELSVVQGCLENKCSLPVHDEATESFASNVGVQADQKEPVAEITNETDICRVHTNETSNELEGKNVDTVAVPMQAEENVPQGSAESLANSKHLDVSSQLLENTILVTEKNESERESLNNSPGPEFYDAAEKIVDGVISSSRVSGEEKSQETNSERGVLTAGIESVDDYSPQTVDILPSEKDPSSSPVDIAVSADKVTEDECMNVISNAEVRSNTELNSSVDVNAHLSVANVLQNGFIESLDTAILAHGDLQHGEFLETNFPDIQISPESSFNTSVGREETTLDSSSDMEIFAETIRKLDSPITLPQKRKKVRTPKVPSPYIGLPPIHEDYLEKILDGETFSFGLGKKTRTTDLAPMALFKMQSIETAEKLKPKRASAEQSMLLKSLRSQKEPQETCDKDNADVEVKKSRIESMYSSLKSFCATREESVFSPTVTTVSTMTCSFDTPRKEFTPSGKTYDFKTTDSAKTPQTAVREDLLAQSQSIPVHSMDSHTESDALAESVTDLNGHQESNPCTTGVEETLPPLESTPKTDKPVKHLTDIFYFNGENEKSLVSSLSSGVPPLQGAEKINPRPGKMVILTEAEYGGAVFEVFSDVTDCSSWELSPTIFIKTIRGCWLLYEQPNFEGRTIALEEGDIEVSNPWGEESQDEDSRTPVVIGSLRHVVKDYRVCQIDLFSDPGGLGVMSSYFDDTEEIQNYGRLQRTCSIKVHWGVWMIYEDAGFQGVPFILEPGEYPDLSFWNTQEAFIGSVRPLKMGSRKVELPNEPKIIIFEKPMFEGRQAVLDKETMTFGSLELQEGSEEDSALPFITVGSMRVISGLWVGYEKPEFEGHQYLLEEGDYEEWSQWGGYNGLLRSLRPVLAEFSSPHMVMYSEKDFDEKAANINVLGIISNMNETGFGVKIQSINVLSGVWVAYECPDFTGEQYILEKGMYSTFSDWGATNCKISSVQPILVEHIESPGGHFKVEVFSEPDFQGQSQTFEEDMNNVEEPFTIMSIKVTSGRWAVHDQADFSGNLWVLEEGIFPNLCAIGCPHNTTIRSLKIINYEFSEPNVMLYGKENFKGRKVKLTKESRDLQALGYSPDLMSLEVLGGIWVLYELSNYRGQQLLISPSKIAQWKQYSGWKRIGSLRPLQQKQLHFKLRNKANGMVMSTNGTMDDIKLLRIQVTEESGAEDQIWTLHKGVFKCRISDECSLANVGTLITGGSKLGLNIDEPGTAAMLWSVSPEGKIFSRSKPNLVLDIKGGSQYDQQHVVLNPVTEGKLSQLWEVCVL